MAEEQDKVSAKALYEQLVTDRDPYLRRARRAAELTVPSLFPKDGVGASTDLEEPSQSLGARGIRNLASKLQMALFPVNAPFFKYTVDDLALQQLTQAEGQRGAVEKALNSRERAVLDEMNGSLFRPVSFEACRQLLIAGNYLLFIPKKGKPRGFRLSSYVVKRDAAGNVIDIVIKESMARTALPPDVVAHLNAVDTLEDAERDAKVDVYTHVAKDIDGDKYTVTQEVDGTELPNDYAGTYTKDNLPWIALRFTYIEGENYGRSFCDEYIGDLATLNGLTKALRDGTIQGAKVVWMVHPNSTVSVRKLAAAENGEFVQGDHQSVIPLQLNKASDFSVAERFIAQLTERLQFAFLLNTAIQRNGERVTAAEIRYMAGELDQGLGGVYSLLSEEFQLPVAKLYELRMMFVRKVPPLPKEITNTAIVTGLDALGRGNDLNNLDALVAGAAQVVGADQVARYLNAGEYFKRRGAALGIDMSGLIKTEEELAQADQQAQLMAMAQNLGPQAIAQMGGLAKQEMVGAQNGTPTPEPAEEE